jgi:hypothetical protein
MRLRTRAGEEGAKRGAGYRAVYLLRVGIEQVVAPVRRNLAQWRLRRVGLALGALRCRHDQARRERYAGLLARQLSPAVEWGRRVEERREVRHAHWARHGGSQGVETTEAEEGDLLRNRGKEYSCLSARRSINSGYSSLTWHTSNWSAPQSMTSQIGEEGPGFATQGAVLRRSSQKNSCRWGRCVGDVYYGVLFH